MDGNIEEKVFYLIKEIVLLSRQGQYERAIPVAQDACELIRRYPAESSWNYSESLTILASLYRNTGNYVAAKRIYIQVLDLRRVDLGENHPDYAESLNNLGMAHLDMGAYGEAERFFSKALGIFRAVLGENDPGYATSLNNLAGLYCDTGNYSAAEPLYRQALEISMAVGKDHPYYATSLNNLALLYRYMGNYTAAEPLYRQALEIRSMALGENHPDYATSLNNLAELYNVMGNYSAAEPLYRQALEVLLGTVGKSHPDYATNLNNLAMLYRDMGNYTAAEPLCRQVLEIRRMVLGENHPDYAAGINNLALLYRDMGNYVAAELYCCQARDIWHTALGEKHPKYATSLNNLAGLYRKMGKYTAAEPLYCQALEIRRLTLGENHPDYATSLNNLAGLYDVMGNYTGAELFYRRALEIWHMALGEDHPDYATVLNSLAMLYRKMGNYTAAEPLCLQALETTRMALGENHPDYAAGLNSLAMLYRKMGNYPEAELLHRQALETTRMALGEDHPDYAQNLNNLAELYRNMGKYDAAEPICRRAMEIRKTLGKNHPDYATSLNNLAVLHHGMGDYAKAELFYRQALDIRRRSLGENHPYCAVTLNNLAELKVAKGMDAEVLELMSEAADIEHRMIGQVFTISSESQRMAYISTLQGGLDSFLTLAVQYLFLFPSMVVMALELVLRRKAIGAEALAAQRDALMSGRYPALKPKLQELRDLRAQIVQKTLSGPDHPRSEGMETHRQLLAEWNVRRERLEGELAREIPEMNLEQKLRTADRWSICRVLPRGTALVEFVRYDTFDFKAVPARDEPEWKPACYIAFVLHGGAPDNVEMIDLGQAETIDRLIAAFRSSISGGERHLIAAEAVPAAKPESGVELHEAVFSPLIPALNGSKRLFLAPDGDLTLLPFEVLPTSDGGHLIDDYHISYLSVGRDILRFGALSTAKVNDPLVIGDPDFDLKDTSSFQASAEPHGRTSRDLDRSRWYFKRLEGMRMESKQVAKLLGVEPWLAAKALERPLKGFSSPRILHLATHGFFLNNQDEGAGAKRSNREMTNGMADSFSGRLSHAMENPLLRSGLALAGANTWLQGKKLPDDAEDGILTAEDVCGMDLSGTDLVVLSACETGLGEVRVGEGVLGLRRAFMLAGAKTLVMSLWKVPDYQTHELMVDFYRRILKGEPRAQALRHAQLAMKEKCPDPYFWGAFICQGESGP